MLSGRTVGPNTAPRAICRTSARPARTPTSVRTAASSRSSTASRRTGNGASRLRARATRFFDGTIQTGCGSVRPRRAVLLPERPLRLHRPRILRPAPVAARGARRPVGRGVHPRARVRPPCPEPDGRAAGRGPRHRPAGWPGAGRAAGRLLRGLWVGNALDTGFIEDLTRQDVADALDAAAAVGDDRIQERTQGRVTPESWTHGLRAAAELVRPRHRGLRAAELRHLQGPRLARSLGTDRARPRETSRYAMNATSAAARILPARVPPRTRAHRHRACGARMGRVPAPDHELSVRGSEAQRRSPRRGRIPPPPGPPPSGGPARRWRSARA